MSDLQRDILGVSVSALKPEEAKALLTSKVEEQTFTPVAFLNAHGANVAIDDPQYMECLKSFLVVPDGIGVDIASRILHGAPFPANLNGTDFIPDWLASIAKPLTVGLVGSKRESAEGAVTRLQALIPQHRFIFVNDGFFDEVGELALLQKLSEIRPDILLVAMGVPKQEFWIQDKLTATHCTMPIGVGALFDFLAGAMPRAPVVMRRMRLEWVYRLAVEPRRLFNRYVIGIPVFLNRLLRYHYKRDRRG